MQTKYAIIFIVIIIQLTSCNIENDLGISKTWLICLGLFAFLIGFGLPYYFDKKGDSKNKKTDK